MRPRGSDWAHFGLLGSGKHHQQQQDPGARYCLHPASSSQHNIPTDASSSASEVFEKGRIVASRRVDDFREDGGTGERILVREETTRIGQGSLLETGSATNGSDIYAQELAWIQKFAG